MKRGILVSLALGVAACGTQPVRESVEPPSSTMPPQQAGTPSVPKNPMPKPTYTLKKGGGFYKDDGPGDNPPEDLDSIPDAIPRAEPLHRFANNPYSVLGKDYVPLKTAAGYKAQGVASWYGKKFHGQKTSTGELYDMYGMTAAHPTLPIPSYVRVTNPANGKTVVLRVNDRGPFHANRIMDLSYTAAWKLGLIGGGSGFVSVESVQPGDVLPISSAMLAAAPPNTTTQDPIAEIARRELQPAATATAAAPAVDVKGIFIQLGAFGNPDNAEVFKNHMSRDLDWLSDRLRIEVAGKIHRVQIGPFASRSEAESNANRIASLLGGKPTLISR